MERVSVSFSLYSEIATGALANNNPLRYEKVNFITGDGTYSTTGTTAYKYICKNAGTYLIGYSYMKKDATSNARANLALTRNGSLITLQTTTMPTDSIILTGLLTISGFTIAQLEIDDILWVRVSNGQPRVNNVAYTAEEISNGDIKNSFWGIRLDYDLTI